MTVDCSAFLAPLECHSIYFCKQLVRGEKKFVKCENARYLSVPQYKGLGIAQFLEYAEQSPGVLDYLPDRQEWDKLPRQWLISLIYPLVGKPFADWALERMRARNDRVIEKQQLAIEMDPEILAAFHASSYVSSKY